MQGAGLDRAEELALALAALDEAARPGALASLAVEAGPMPEPGARLSAQAGVTRQTKTLVFLEATVTDPAGRLTLALSAVYRRAPA